MLYKLFQIIIHKDVMIVQIVVAWCLYAMTVILHQHEEAN